MVTESIQNAIEFARSRHDTTLEGFQELLRIPSVSTDPAYKSDVERCADWIIAEMTRIGFNNSRKIATNGHPIVYGEWLEAGEDKPTVLVYAHYDVQPVNASLWQSPPFEPTFRDGRLYARGAIDDKQGVWGNLKAFEAIFATEGKLPVNVKLFFEGEEEMGSPNVQPAIRANKDLFAAAVFMIFDGPFNTKEPIIYSSGRGLAAAEVTVTCPDHDLHSGHFGGTVQNPLHVVGKIVGSFHDDTGRIQIPGFYDRVRPLDEAELQRLQKTWEVIGPGYEQRAGTQHFWAEELGIFPVRMGALPTLDVNGIWGGYQGLGTKTVIPSRAGFKVTMRLVANQEPEETAQLFKDYIMGFASKTAKIEVTVSGEAWPYFMKTDGPLAEALVRTYQAEFEQTASISPSGATIPIAGTLQHELGISISRLSFGSGNNNHAPDEYIDVQPFLNGIDRAIRYYYELGVVWRQ